MNVFTFDIETVPDVAAARRIYGLGAIDDAQVAELMFAKRRHQVGRDFLPHHMHRVVAISAALRTADRFKVWSLGDEDSSEAELVGRFFDGVDRYSPTLVSWNGSGFDLPVLHYRALLHGVAAPRYWETGDEDTTFRWNNYISRYHQRHTDLMDVLAGYQPRASAPLDQLATLCGFPGKLGMSGADVWGHYLQGRIAEIRHYCETDVVNTFLLYLRFQLMRGQLDSGGYARECGRIRAELSEMPGDHWTSFLRAWTNGDGL